LIQSSLAASAGSPFAADIQSGTVQVSGSVGARPAC
jgi:hypothetical protein